MSKIVKTILIISAFVGLGFALYFGIFDRILEKMPFVKEYYNNSVLTVNVRRGAATVYLNETDYGQTPQSVYNLAPGGYAVELERIADNQEAYPKQSFYIELYRNTEAVIDIEIAPDNLKSGHILYYSPMPKTLSGDGAISLRSDVDDYKVLLNDEELNLKEIISYRLKPNEYQIQVIADGYETLEFPAIVREGFNLNIRVYLLPIPMNF